MDILQREIYQMRRWIHGDRVGLICEELPAQGPQVSALELEDGHHTAFTRDVKPSQTGVESQDIGIVSHFLASSSSR